MPKKGMDKSLFGWSCTFIVSPIKWNITPLYSITLFQPFDGGSCTVFQKEKQYSNALLAPLSGSPCRGNTAAHEMIVYYPGEARGTSWYSKWKSTDHQNVVSVQGMGNYPLMTFGKHEKSGDALLTGSHAAGQRDRPQRVGPATQTQPAQTGGFWCNPVILVSVRARFLAYLLCLWPGAGLWAH